MRLLIGYDASAGARDAAELIAGLPLPAGSIVRITCVLEPFLMPVPWAAPILVGEASIEPDARMHLEGDLRAVAARMLPAAPPSTWSASGRRRPRSSRRRSPGAPT